MVRKHLGPLRDALGLSHDTLMGLGRENPANPGEQFCMTVLGLRMARRANAVSALHGEVSRAMWTGLYPGKTEDTVPIGHITNGVHVPTFLHQAWADYFDGVLATNWRERLRDADFWKVIEALPDERYWETSQSVKAQMLASVRERLQREYVRKGLSAAQCRHVTRLLDPARPDVLTIGFARRFATYKRAALLLRDRAHFFAVAAKAMRQIVVDHARRRQADKRGGAAAEAVTLDENSVADSLDPETLTRLDSALSQLQQLEPRLAELVEMRFFAGLSVVQVAELREVATRTVLRDWRRARAYLFDSVRAAQT